MTSWETFAATAPEMAEGGRKLIYQYGIGLGFLATVRRDGGPRLHPFCPVLFENHLYGLIIPSPKREDLHRDGRYAIHALQPEQVDDEFYVTGKARYVADEALTGQVRDAFVATGATSSADEELFEFDIDHAMLATYEKRGQWPPLYQKWSAADATR
jgi:hypothetical protein